MKNYRIWLNGIIGCILYLPLSAFAELWGVPYLQNAMHYSSSEAAGTISAVFLGWAIGGPLAGRLSDVTENRILPMFVGAISCGAIISIILAFPNISHWTLSILLFLFGVSSSVQVIVFAFCRDLSPLKLSGTALALTNMIVMLGAIISQPAIGILLDWVGNKEGVSKLSLSYSLSDYQFALSILPLSMGLCCILLGILWWSCRHTKTAPGLEAAINTNSA
jgi:MFS family permease